MTTPSKEKEPKQEMPRLSLACPYCDSRLEALLEYRPGSYSEHRDHTGYACFSDLAVGYCSAEWDSTGKLIRYPDGEDAA